MAYRLGKCAAQHDALVPRLSLTLPGLAAPPQSANWYGSVRAWPMLANDRYADCVEAAVLHCIEQLSGYAMRLQLPTEAEAIKFYEDATGFTPADPESDQGSYVLGRGGVMNFWLNQGVTCGGKISRLQAFLQIRQKNPVEWMQGIHFFGGMLTGLMMPESIVHGTPPAVWDSYSGPIAGGHCVWINGYDSTPTGRIYHLVSWGRMYLATEAFLMHCVDETIVVIDPAELNARGVNVSGLNMDQLLANMKALHAEG